MLTLVMTGKFRKDVKILKKRNYPLDKLMDIIRTLQREKPLAPKHRDHALVGDYIGFRECHIEPDWLLIYQITQEQLILTAARTGTHSDLF